MLNFLKGVFRYFQEDEVRYLVIGGVAAMLYGVPGTTLDLEIIIEATPDNAARLIRALLKAGVGTAEVTTVEGILANDISIFEDWVRVDVMTRTPGLEFCEAWPRRQTMTYQGQEYYVVSKSDLIAAKRASGRPVDLEDVRLLENPDSDSQE